MLIPRREYTKLWHRMLHDRSSGSITAVLSDVPHCNVTIVPYHLGTTHQHPDVAMVTDTVPDWSTPGHPTESFVVATDLATANLPGNRTRIAEIPPRLPTTFAGRVRAMRVQPWGGNPALECVIADETGSVVVVFFGRRELGGVRLGTVLRVEGVVGEYRGRRSILTPRYTVISTPSAPMSPNHHEH